MQGCRVGTEDLGTPTDNAFINEVIDGRPGDEET